MPFSQLSSAFLLSLVVSTPAWAVYKCQDASGRTSFQQAPCADGTTSEKLNVQPASGAYAPAQEAAPLASGASTPPQTETDRLNAQALRLARENRLSTLNNLTIGAAQGDILRARERCQAEINALRNRKGQATHDLAGATWEQSLSSEMQAVAAQCDTEQRRLQAIFDRYMAEKQDIERELAKP